MTQNILDEFWVNWDQKDWADKYVTMRRVARRLVESIPSKEDLNNLRDKTKNLQDTKDKCIITPSREWLEEQYPELKKEIEDNGGKAAIICFDATDEAAFSEAINVIVESDGELGYLVNNAGITNDKLDLRMKTEEFMDVVDAIADLEDTDITAVINTIEITTYKEYKETH